VTADIRNAGIFLVEFKNKQFLNSCSSKDLIVNSTFSVQWKTFSQFSKSPWNIDHYVSEGCNPPRGLQLCPYKFFRRGRRSIKLWVVWNDIMQQDHSHETHVPLDATSLKTFTERVPQCFNVTVLPFIDHLEHFSQHGAVFLSIPLRGQYSSG